ncbi:MAG: Eco57I restriction-modification methylase domain-containing protein, partial [Nanoarchaeota archaeon]
MNRIEDEIRLKRVLKEFSSDFHNSFTPFELCDEMLDKLPMLNINQDILVMFNLEFIYTIKERINNLDKVWFITPCEIKAQVAEAIGVKKNHIFFYSYKDKEIEKIDNMPKFDVVIGNPPYHKGLHMKFLEIAFNNSK